MNAEKRQYTCQPDQEEVKSWRQADNDEGVLPPSETARPLMGKNTGKIEGDGDVERPQR